MYYSGLLWISGKESTSNARATEDVGSIPWEDPLAEGMATHSSIPAWRIPWIEDPGGLQFMGLLRVRHCFTTLYSFLLYSKVN